MMKIINRYPFVSHLLFWLGVWLLDAISGDVFKKFYPNSVYGAAHVIPQIIASYLTVYYLIPKLFLKKKYLSFGFWFILSAYVIAVLARIIMVHVAEPMVREQPFDQESIYEIFTQVKWLLLGYFPSIYIMVFFFWLITFLNFSRKDLSLKKEKVSTELKMLKSQLNPHFLFNTLNNIYSLSVDNSPKTSESIGRLSKILDYALYKCDSKFVPLNAEVQLLEDYIELEKLRYDDRLSVKFEKNVQGPVEIAPLILLSFVENAFKHGAGEDKDFPEINISLEANQNNIEFNISNTIRSTFEEKSRDSIGLQNIKKQLDLIYPNQYQLDIKKKENSFSVKLLINI